MKRNNYYLAISLSITQLVLLNSNISNAQQNPVRKLDEVVVTASRSQKKQSEIGKVVKVITAETLSKSQGRTLPEILNNVAGLTIGGNGNNSGDIKSVYLRGASAGNTLILIDGIPVNDASQISGEYNISAIAVDMIDRIEIVKGGNSTLYGSDAVAGVINIITKKGTGKLGANVLATAGSNNTYKQALVLNGIVDKTSISFNASNLKSTNFSTAAPRNGELNFDKDGLNQLSLGLNLSQEASSNLILKANFQANENIADLDNGAFSDAKNYVYDKASFLGGFGGQLKLDKGALNFNLSQNNVKNLFNNNGAITKNLGQISQMEAGLNYVITEFADLTSGVSYKYSETDQKSPYGNLTADNNIKSIFSSLFFKTDSGEFRAEIGGRYNSHSQYGDNFTYTLNPSYIIANRYKLFVNVSSAYRVPSLYQLYSPYGNLELKPEISNTYESGVDLDIFPQKLNLTLSVFLRKIKDVIDFGELPSGNFGYLNQNKQNDKGLELEVSYKANHFLNIDAFYAYVDGELTTPLNTSFNLFRRPKNSVGANVGVELNKALSFNLIYKWVDKRIDRYYDSSIGEYGENVDAKLSSFSLMDAYIQFKPSTKLTLFTDIQNIFDEKYTEFAGYNTRGLNFNAGLKYDIK